MSAARCLVVAQCNRLRLHLPQSFHLVRRKAVCCLQHQDISAHQLLMYQRAMPGRQTGTVLQDHNLAIHCDHLRSYQARLHTVTLKPSSLRVRDHLARLQQRRSKCILTAERRFWPLQRRCTKHSRRRRYRRSDSFL